MKLLRPVCQTNTHTSPLLPCALDRHTLLAALPQGDVVTVHAKKSCQLFSISTSFIRYFFENTCFVRWWSDYGPVHNWILFQALSAAYRLFSQPTHNPSKLGRRPIYFFFKVQQISTRDVLSGFSTTPSNQLGKFTCRAFFLLYFLVVRTM